MVELGLIVRSIIYLPLVIYLATNLLFYLKASFGNVFLAYIISFGYYGYKNKSDYKKKHP